MEIALSIAADTLLLAIPSVQSRNIQQAIVEMANEFECAVFKDSSWAICPHAFIESRIDVALPRKGFTGLFAVCTAYQGYFTLLYFTLPTWSLVTVIHLILRYSSDRIMTHALIMHAAILQRELIVDQNVLNITKNKWYWNCRQGKVFAFRPPRGPSHRLIPQHWTVCWTWWPLPIYHQRNRCLKLQSLVGETPCERRISSFIPVNLPSEICRRAGIRSFYVLYLLLSDFKGQRTKDKRVNIARQMASHNACSLPEILNQCTRYLTQCN